MIRKFVVKILTDSINNDYTYKIVSAHNEYSCREACKNDDIIFIFEVDKSVWHWDSYEIGLLYSWIDQEKGFLPINHQEVIRDYIADNYKERNIWILYNAKIFNESMSDFYTFKQYNKCIDLLNLKPLMIE